MIWLALLTAQAAEVTYQQPPEDIQAILDADSPPAVSVSPAGDTETAGGLSASRIA